MVTKGGGGVSKPSTSFTSVCSALEASEFADLVARTLAFPQRFDESSRQLKTTLKLKWASVVCYAPTAKSQNLLTIPEGRYPGRLLLA